jgi:hypothetical protein
MSFPLITCDVPSVPIAKNVASANERLKNFALQTKNVEYYDFNKYLCPNGSCSVYDDNGKLMYYDSSHLSLSASWQLGNNIYQHERIPFSIFFNSRTSKYPKTYRQNYER